MDADRQEHPLRVDFEQALDSMPTYIDINVDDLAALYDRARQFAERRRSHARPAAAIMSSPVHSIGPDDNLVTAVDVLIRHRISGLPVVDEAGRLVGILTEADLLRALGVPVAEPAHTLWQTLESWVRHLDQSSRLADPKGRVADHMSRQVVTVGADDSLQHVLDTLQKHRVKRVVVSDEEGRPLGIITRSNLVHSLFRGLAGADVADAATALAMSGPGSP